GARTPTPRPASSKYNLGGQRPASRHYSSYLTRRGETAIIQGADHHEKTQLLDLFNYRCQRLSAGAGIGCDAGGTTTGGRHSDPLRRKRCHYPKSEVAQDNSVQHGTATGCHHSGAGGRNRAAPSG